MNRSYLLVVREGSSFVFPLPRTGLVSVGRAQEAELRIDERSISREHARLILADGEVRLMDLGSRNGTCVNGQRLEAAQRLAPGDVVTMGTVTLVLQGGGRPLEPVPGGEAPVTRTTLRGHTLVIADPAMHGLHALIQRLAVTELPVLVSGETGTGKELAASAVHYHSRRSDKPFVTLNCAALQDTLVESELFGYERGAFSGATTSKPGLLEVASGGTVFLDEIGELSPVGQAKLLRALESGRITRLGDVRERSIDIRIVAATNRDLQADVRAGRFRQDLLFRL
ncbi:MAG TPA: sigma-54-dependent Fis family transcriptional regulator, partial [Aggregicoccus sp.]|nr:sigma-54-dependent Fis family transcriptional regulator [Aggregicoccus sp.]